MKLNRLFSELAPYTQIGDSKSYIITSPSEDPGNTYIHFFFFFCFEKGNLFTFILC